MTPTSVAVILKLFITECKGDTYRINLSYVSANRYNVEAVNNIALKIRENWAPPKNQSNIGMTSLWTHWMVQVKLKDYQFCYQELGGSKVLGLPQLSNLAGDLTRNLISSATLQLLDAWNCRDVVYGMV